MTQAVELTANLTAQLADPISFRGIKYAAKKEFVYGTHRICPPEETLQRIRPFFRQMGITRIADITGLDRIGIPVTLVLRPNSPTMSNSTGKGFTLAAAEVSGAMESIEVYHAENPQFTVINASYREMQQQADIMPLDQLPFTRNTLFKPGQPERWTMGWDLLQQHEVAVPVSLVEMVGVERSGNQLFNFQVGSNGLASGNNFLEALNAALLEVIERDAVSCQQVAWLTLSVPPPKVRLQSISSPLVQSLIQQLEAAEMEVNLFEMTVDTGIPVYMAYIVDLRNYGTIASGYGAHLDSEIAMIRALTEAVQSRVIFIAGSRDEHFRHHQMIFQKLGSTHAKTLHGLQGAIDCDTRPSQGTTTFEGDIQTILNQLRRVGLGQAIIFDLTHPGMPFSVIRAVVPGLEGYRFAYYRPGPRAQAFVQQKALTFR